MRTTIRLDKHLLAEAKQYANEIGKTLTRVIEDALREILARRHTCRRREPIRLTTVEGKGLQRDIDLDDSAALLEVMEQKSGSA
jgi:hypothetical protein